MACSCPTARATRRRRGLCGAARSRSWWRPDCRCSASASATRCWGWRSAPRRSKMHQGHHGANHPVKDFTTGKVEITSMNHGFAVDRDTLPARGRGDAPLPVRRLQLRPAAEGQAGVLGAVPPRGLAGTRGQPLPVHALRQPDAREEGAAAATGTTRRAQAIGRARAGRANPCGSIECSAPGSRL